MKNVSMRVDGNDLIITIDLAEPTTPSKSGKTLVIASTQGNKKLPNSDIVVGLNCYKPR